LEGDQTRTETSLLALVRQAEKLYQLKKLGQKYAVTVEDVEV
jgi:hypothetical protein